MSELLKLKDTSSKNAFRYGYLLNKMYPYIKTVIFRTILLFIKKNRNDSNMSQYNNILFIKFIDK